MVSEIAFSIFRYGRRSALDTAWRLTPIFFCKTRNGIAPHPQLIKDEVSPGLDDLMRDNIAASILCFF